MQGTTLRSQLRTNTPGHTEVVGEVSYTAGVPAVSKGTRFTVGRGVLALTLGETPTIVVAPNGTYTVVPVTTANGSTAICSLTVAGGVGVISVATVTAPGYDYTAAAAMSVVVGSLFQTAGSLAATSAVAGTYYVSIGSSSSSAAAGSGMVAKVVVAGGNITVVTVNPTVDALTAVGSGFGPILITISLAAGALYTGSPAVANAFTLTPNPTISVAAITPVITGNCSIVYANKVLNTVKAVASPIIRQIGNTFFLVSQRYTSTTYVNFSTLNASNATATPSDGDGFSFSIVTSDTSVTQ